MKQITLKKINTRAPRRLNKAKLKKEFKQILKELSDMQNLLFAEGKHSILIVVQGMDGSGKDGLTRDVFSRMNPQGVRVTSYKKPTEKELSHDFLWRIHHDTPAKGMIQIFNRSHYEDILVTRVHNLIDDKTAKKRIRAINNFEQMLADNNTHILKFYLHISPEEQKKRLNERMSDKTKMWKYNPADLEESKLWDVYIKQYQDAFDKCNVIPWKVIPADQNWYKSYLVAKALLKQLKSLDMKFPGMKK